MSERGRELERERERGRERERQGKEREIKIMSVCVRELNDPQDSIERSMFSFLSCSLPLKVY